MKWFKHLSGSLNNSFIFELIENFGGDGYLVFFGTLELMSDEFDIQNPGVNRISLKKMQKNFQLSRQKTVKILRFCDKKAKEKKKKKVAFFVTFEKDHVIINCKRLAELCDEHTQRLLKKQRDLVPSESGVATDQDTDTDTDTDLNTGIHRRGGGHFENKVGEYLDSILKEFELINQFKQNGEKLNQKVLPQWVQEKANEGGHPEAISGALNWLRQVLGTGEDIKNFRGFVEKTFQTLNPRFNSRDAERESNAFKNVFIENEQVREILKGIGQ